MTTFIHVAELVFHSCNGVDVTTFIHVTELM